LIVLPLRPRLVNSQRTNVFRTAPALTRNFIATDLKSEIVIFSIEKRCQGYHDKYAPVSFSTLLQCPVEGNVDTLDGSTKLAVERTRLASERTVLS
jgi:hypothetical protein